MKKVSKRIKKQIFNILFLLVLVGITLYVLLTCTDVNFKDIGNFISISNPWLLTLSVLCMIAGIICEGLSIHIISRKFGHKSKLVSSMAYSTADIYFSAITPSATGGQPASAYYMVKDGMGAGTASFTLLLNAIAYTAALIILGAFAFILRPHTFAGFDFWIKFFIIFGMSVQALLLGLFIACMYCHRVVLKVGNGLISLLVKIKLVKNEEKWRTKLVNEVEKYRNCVKEIRKHKLLFINSLLLNLAQRVVRVLISCFICLAADPNADFMGVFAMQSFVMVGYTFLPVPGGVGAFEYLYLNIYGALYTSQAFIGSAMMVMRTVSYYLSIIVSGLFTLGYHIALMRRKVPEPVLTDEGEPPSEEPEEKSAAEEEEIPEVAEITEEQSENDEDNQ